MGRQETLAERFLSRIEFIEDCRGCPHLKRPHSRPSLPLPPPPSKSEKKETKSPQTSDENKDEV